MTLASAYPASAGNEGTVTSWMQRLVRAAESGCLVVTPGVGGAWPEPFSQSVLRALDVATATEFGECRFAISAASDCAPLRDVRFIAPLFFASVIFSTNLHVLECLVFVVTNLLLCLGNHLLLRQLEFGEFSMCFSGMVMLTKGPLFRREGDYVARLILSKVPGLQERVLWAGCTSRARTCLCKVVLSTMLCGIGSRS